MKFPVSIILVEPENPDNIGAAARAMKNMAFKDLRLVRPPSAWKEKGRKMAMGARDILESAGVYSGLEKAIGDTSLVIGTTRRSGAKRGMRLAFAKAIQEIKRTSQRNPVAIVFGKESKGLDNKSLGLCDWVTTIPANPDYPSLNLAQAVMLVAFSLSGKDSKQHPIQPSPELSYASKEATLDVLRRFKKALQSLHYEEEGNGVTDRILATLHGLFKRNGLLESEAQMLRGISRRVCERVS